jgi:hypothetical protein
VAVPVADGAKVTEQLPVAASVQLGALRVLLAVVVKATVPVGVMAAPAAVVSATVAVHVLACPTTTGVVHDTVVKVVLGFTVMVPEPLLVAWVVSPLYALLIVSVPDPLGVNVTEHVAELPVPLNVQLGELRVPAALVVKLTVPVGVVGVVNVSVTVAVHVEPWFTTTGLEQVTLVVVVSGALTANGTLIV